MTQRSASTDVARDDSSRIDAPRRGAGSLWYELALRIRRLEAADLDGELTTLVETSSPIVVGFLNAHAMNLANRDHAFRESLGHFARLYRDGSGMAILFRLLRLDPGHNLNGTDLIPKIISRYPGRRIALLGTQDPQLSAAAKVVGELAPEAIITAHHGFEDDAFYLQHLLANPSDLVVLAMGMPRQERLARYLAENLPYPCLLVCGGAILDFLGGRVPRAPGAFRNIGLEWLYRLWREPRRLFGRYVIGNPLFLGRALLLAITVTVAKRRV